MQEQVIPLRCVRGALRGATILVDRLGMMAGALEQVCTSRGQPVVGREAWIRASSSRAARPASGPLTIARAIARLRLTIGLSWNRSTS